MSDLNMQKVGKNANVDFLDRHIDDGFENPKKTLPVISICIPTFERPEFLEYLLSNIFEQIGSDSELTQVVVSDNFSKDSTWSVVDKYQRLSMNLKYVRSFKNMGFSSNLNSVVSVADGKYCWLMGDDDAMRPGAIGFMSELLKLHSPDISISNRYTCDNDLKVLGVENFLPGASGNKIFDFNIRSEMLEYLAGVKTTIGMFNFMSNIVVKRDCWIRAPDIPGISTTLFPHVFKVIDILRNQACRLLYVSEPTIFARTGNDRSIWTDKGSPFRKWQLHFAGNIDVADFYFSDDRVAYDAFLGPIRGIISSGRDHYISLAEKEGCLDEAVMTLKKLKIAR